MAGIISRMAALSGLLRALTGVLTAASQAARALRATVGAVAGARAQPPAAYTTLWLRLELEIADARGERATLTRRQRVRFRSADAPLVRELVWGEGEQLVRYTVRGARRAGLRAEGSKRAVLLLPRDAPAPGDRLTLTSRRTIRGGFRGREEYCEVFLERPTARLDLVVRFPRRRPPQAARLVLGGTEQVLRRVPVRFESTGRAVLRCRLKRPALQTTLSLRWSW